MFKGLSSTKTATENWDALISSGAAVQSGTAHDTLRPSNMTASKLSNYAGDVFKFV